MNHTPNTAARFSDLTSVNRAHDGLSKTDDGAIMRPLDVRILNVSHSEPKPTKKILDDLVAADERSSRPSVRMPIRLIPLDVFGEEFEQGWHVIVKFSPRRNQTHNTRAPWATPVQTVFHARPKRPNRTDLAIWSN